MRAARRFESFEAGQRVDLGARELSEAEIIAFARRFDPQPGHLDPAAAAAGPLGGLAASGWHVTGLAMRLFYDGLLAEVASLGSPGVAEARWTRPTRPGLVVGRFETLATRPSSSRPEIGLIEAAIELSQAGETVFRQRFTYMALREGAQTPIAPAARPAPAPDPQADALIAEARAPAPWSSVEEIVFDRPIALGDARVEAEAVIAFARDFDPQPFHLSEEAGRASLFGGLAASGWHTTALWMGRLVRSVMGAIAALPPDRRKAALGAIGPGLGLKDLRWRRPVLAGDSLRCFAIPRAAGPFPGRPDWRILTLEAVAVNQRGERVISFLLDSMARGRN